MCVWGGINNLFCECTGVLVNQNDTGDVELVFLGSRQRAVCVSTSSDASPPPHSLSEHR